MQFCASPIFSVPLTINCQKPFRVREARAKTVGCSPRQGAFVSVPSMNRVEVKTAVSKDQNTVAHGSMRVTTADILVVIC